MYWTYKIATPLFLLVLIVFGCRQSGYAPSHLRKLTPEEVVQRAFSRTHVSPYTVFRDSLGQQLDSTLREQLNKGKLHMDQYVDDAGQVVEIVVRSMTGEDELWAALAREASLTYYASAPVSVDCRDAKRILLQLYKRHLNTNHDNLSFWRFSVAPTEEQSRVISLIERCGFPRAAAVTQTGVEAVYHLLDAGQWGWLAKWYPDLIESMELGEFPRAYVAYLEDTILARHGYPQRYGTYIGISNLQRRLGYHPIRDSTQVDTRRAAMNLPPYAVELARRDSLRQLDSYQTDSLEHWRSFDSTTSIMPSSSTDSAFAEFLRTFKSDTLTIQSPE